jgi:hypothetical protein
MALLLAIAIGAAAPGVAKPPKPKPTAPAGFEQQILYISLELDPGEKVSAYWIDCPKGWDAEDGGLESDPSRTRVTGSEPGGYHPDPALAKRSWVFDFENVTEERTVVTLWVACRRPKAVPKPVRKVVRKRVPFAIPGLKATTIKPRCRKNTVPAGFGWSLLGPNPEPAKTGVAAAAVDDGARITGIKPTARGHEVTFTAGSDDVAGHLVQICFPEKVTTRKGERRRVTVERHRMTTMAPAGSSTVTSTCGRGRTSFGTPGFSTDPAVTVAPSVAPNGDPQLRVSNATGQPAQLTMFTSCTRGRVVHTGVTVDTTSGPITITSGP